MDKQRIEEQIQCLQVALEDLSSANDCFIEYAGKEEERFNAYTTAIDYITKARLEIKSEIHTLQDKIM